MFIYIFFNNSEYSVAQEKILNETDGSLDW